MTRLEARTYRCCTHCHEDPVHAVPEDGHTVPCNATHDPCIGKKVSPVCEVVEVDGEPVRVQGLRPMTPEDRQAFAEVVRAARRKFEEEEAQRRADLGVHARWCPVDDHGDCICQPSPPGPRPHPPAECTDPSSCPAHSPAWWAAQDATPEEALATLRPLARARAERDRARATIARVEAVLGDHEPVSGVEAELIADLRAALAQEEKP